MRISRAFAIATCTLAVLAAIAAGQSSARATQARPQPRQVVVSDAPVTGDEAKKIFQKVESAFRKVIPSLPKGTATKLRGNQPAARSAIVEELDRLFQIARPSFKSSPKRENVDVSKLSLRDVGARNKLAALVGWGCIEAGSPLAVATKDTMGVLEFGDAVGVFVKRIAELSHTPSDKYSPDRMQPSDRNDPNAGVGKPGG